MTHYTYLTSITVNLPSMAMRCVQYGIIVWGDTFNSNSLRKIKTAKAVLFKHFPTFLIYSQKKEPKEAIQ